MVFRADRYANKKDACAAGKLGNDSFVGAVSVDEPNERSKTSSSSSSNVGRANRGKQLRFADDPHKVANHGANADRGGPDHLRAYVGVVTPVRTPESSDPSKHL